MKSLARILIIVCFVLISACGPVKNQISHQYKLSAFSEKRMARHHSNRSVLVLKPTAVSGYQTNRMVYVKKPYQLSAFTKNQWVSTPPDMFLPLIVESLSKSGYFYAVAVMPYGGKTDYSVNTTIMKMQQNYLKKPSRFELVVKAIVLDTNNKPRAAKTFSQSIATPEDTPYGGVIAANLAAKRITGQIAKFVVDSARQR
jgi:cholesterol transport system auxiliary component